MPQSRSRSGDTSCYQHMSGYRRVTRGTLYDVTSFLTNNNKKIKTVGLYTNVINYITP